MGKERRYCKNKTKGSRRGRKWDEATRTGVLMDMIAANNICAVARKWGVPESTIRTWISEEMAKPEGIYEQARREAARQVAAAAADAALKQVGYLARRVEANARNAEICEGLAERLRQDGYPVLSGPRVTGDGYYESCVLDPDGNTVEIVA